MLGHLVVKTLRICEIGRYTYFFKFTVTESLIIYHKPKFYILFGYNIIKMCKIKYFICDLVLVTKNCDLFKQK